MVNARDFVPIPLYMFRNSEESIVSWRSMVGDLVGVDGIIAEDKAGETACTRFFTGTFPASRHDNLFHLPEWFKKRFDGLLSAPEDAAADGEETASSTRPFSFETYSVLFTLARSTRIMRPSRQAF